LKRLKGTPIARHDDTFSMVYTADPPYEILRNADIDFETMQRLRRFARIWDLVANSGNFVESHLLIWGEGSPYEGFMAFSDHVFSTERRTHAIALTRLTRIVFDYLVGPQGLDPKDVAPVLLRDYQRGQRNDLPRFLLPHLEEAPARVPKRAVRGHRLAVRQRRHAGK